MKLSRRQFTLGLGSLAFAGVASRLAIADAGLSPLVAGYGPLVPDPDGLLDLPKGFSYRVVSKFGDMMSDGFAVPDKADGMGCFPYEGTKVALVRNHEMKPSNTRTGPFARKAAPADMPAYDRFDNGVPLPGGTTTIIYDLATGHVDRQFISLIGTIRNCAGGQTPWGSWLTCEEDISLPGDPGAKDHGWIFEVPSRAEGPVEPVPLKAMGRFNHEAAAVDPRSGIVYLTEDRDDGLFYRFIPEVPGDLAKGGRLQALAFVAKPAGGDSRNWNGRDWGVGQWQQAFWVDLDDVHSPNDDLRERGAAKGAVTFARAEGIHWGKDELYFCCTSGGVEGYGQIMRYKPSSFEGTAKEGDEPGRIQLFLESPGPDVFDFGDNLTVAPNGHLIVCEDQYTTITDNHLRGVTPDGKVYTLGELKTQTELAGVCFSPDGATMFVNVYSPAKTLAITGPWSKFRT
ncbi:alkaline phosphatase PhoX [Gimibacter soli]|uniref:DUF839 domain-containing protein n=1 Tax=Gimibacter soli TaxID=3024400 RepID=A0AAE9XUX3_9PROT|nr:alkaline phosphatase PhoX [Gimibacter soli]WCL53244.1 DUF839 domain-containing protein [Gimibacter soli]